MDSSNTFLIFVSILVYTGVIFIKLLSYVFSFSSVIDTKTIIIVSVVEKV